MSLTVSRLAAMAVSILCRKWDSRTGLTFITALHFHLALANDTSASSAPKTPSGSRYEETEFTYEPLLDEGRDSELIDLSLIHI